MAGLAFALLMLRGPALLFGLALTLGRWARGAGAIVFPGAGPVVATPLIFITLLLGEVVAAGLAASLVRYTMLAGVSSWMGRA